MELKLNPALQYSKDASLADIFGPNVTPGRVLLDEIIKTYKVGLLGLGSMSTLSAPLLIGCGDYPYQPKGKGFSSRHVESTMIHLSNGSLDVS